MSKDEIALIYENFWLYYDKFKKKDNKGKCLSVLALAFQCIILWIVEKNYKCAILKEES